MEYVQSMICTWFLINAKYRSQASVSLIIQGVCFIPKYTCMMILIHAGEFKTTFATVLIVVMKTFINKEMKPNIRFDNRTQNEQNWL